MSSTRKYASGFLKCAAKREQVKRNIQMITVTSIPKLTTFFQCSSSTDVYDSVPLTVSSNVPEIVGRSIVDERDDDTEINVSSMDRAHENQMSATASRPTIQSINNDNNCDTVSIPYEAA